ncbi:MAG: hypothetical protein GX033_06390 [Firmicutes bacterium]|nr:hypothetical protein [Bacillota bacterium]
MRQLNKAGFWLSHNNDLDWHMGGYHLHDYYEINFVLTDDVEFFVAEKVYRARAGALFVFNDLDCTAAYRLPKWSMSGMCSTSIPSE